MSEYKPYFPSVAQKEQSELHSWTRFLLRHSGTLHSCELSSEAANSGLLHFMANTSFCESYGNGCIVEKADYGRSYSRDLPYKGPSQYPDVFTPHRNKVEPLREAPRKSLPATKALPPLPSKVPPQSSPFSIPSTLGDIIHALQKPVSASCDVPNPPKQPHNPSAHTAIPFSGGETSAHRRLTHLLASGAMTRYKDTRNGLLGSDLSSKLSSFLAFGSLTARQVHFAMFDFEEGRDDRYKGAQGYGKGENKGTAHMRFELLWRDYMRLVTQKFGPRLFRAEGFKNDTSAQWGYDEGKLKRWLEGTSGMGLVDASQRELFFTGYTSNRARQNVASYLAKHLGLDWRLGAEWYEHCLVDYDVCSNWGNWQYTAGVGNDPREGGGGRKFNPVKQANDYDANAEYIKTWVPETRELSAQEAFQCWKTSGDKSRLGIMAEDPLVRIEYHVGKGRGGGPPAGGRGRGGRGGGGRGKGRDGFSKRDIV